MTNVLIGKEETQEECQVTTGTEMEGCAYKPRNAKDFQQPPRIQEEVREDPGLPWWPRG